jgi:hypothetical protein
MELRNEGLRTEEDPAVVRNPNDMSWQLIYLLTQSVYSILLSYIKFLQYATAIEILHYTTAELCIIEQENITGLHVTYPTET